MDSFEHGPALLSPHRQPGFAVFNGTHAELLELLTSHPRARVQDPTSARPAMGTRELRPRLIADLCAGRGTKTAQLAEIHPAAQIIASDADPGRHQALVERFAGHDRLTVIARSQWLEYAGQVDLLVLDVPCSNTGVLARRVEAKYRFTGKHLEEIVSLQRQILADSLALRSPSGRVLYATCSIDRRENQEQAAWLTRWHSLERESEELTMPAGMPGDTPATYHDGGYWVLMK
jgi:16S rRNA (cytosine967-C5)-methyltransferase